MKTEIIQKYDKGVPRYTSYPTAHLFKPDFEASTYTDWLQAIPKEMPLSLYSHIPYCDSLCWFCGCHTKITQKYKPIKEYMGSLQKEILMTADVTGRGRSVNHMHFGGGSPTILVPEDVKELFQTFHEAFTFTDDAEIAVEIDPRDISQEAIRAWAQGGVNRASLGVQDIQDKVQRAINRIQPIEQTAKVANWLHEEGVHGINMDLMYGLPYQTVESVLETIRQVMTMDPERIALFGYAHIPSLKPHQRLIPEEVLPDFNERFEQQEAAAELLQSYGFVRIGLDHFAKPDDPMAIAFMNGTLRRNFQGYTTDKADAMIGFGASSIGALPSGFVQNIVAIRNYRAAIDSGNFAYMAAQSKTTGIFIPPFRRSLSRNSRGEFDDILSKLQNNYNELDKAILIVPSGVLSSQTSFNIEARKQIVSSDALEYVIGFPNGMFEGTAINVSMLIFDFTNRNSQIFFFDATNLLKEDVEVVDVIETINNKKNVADVSRMLIHEDIINFNLNPKQYVIDIDNIEGDAHDQTFFVTCRVEGMTHTTHGVGRSRRRAEQQAADANLAGLIATLQGNVSSLKSMQV